MSERHFLDDYIIMKRRKDASREDFPGSKKPGAPDPAGSLRNESFAESLYDKGGRNPETQDLPALAGLPRGAEAGFTPLGPDVRPKATPTPTGSLAAHDGDALTPSRTLSPAVSEPPRLQDLDLDEASPKGGRGKPSHAVPQGACSPNSRKRPAASDFSSDQVRLHGRSSSGPETPVQRRQPQAAQLYDPRHDSPLRPKADVINSGSPQMTSSPFQFDSRTHVIRSRSDLPVTGFGQPEQQSPYSRSSGQSFSSPLLVDSERALTAKLGQPPFEAFSEGESGFYIRQPETRPISQEQLVNEVKGIYAGLVMVEKKCVEIDQQQANAKNRLSNEQWQALIALHRTLLHEHHDFFLASQHPSASPALLKLATKYAMPARMWRHGIHSFLELLRHRLPDSLDHMLVFIYLAYSMMALLMESVPSFEETWIECLGDLARYRMAIEEADLRDREVWAGVARYWYSKAADKSPKVGRIQHHLAVLARPNIVQQLFYYSKALVCVQPFQNARESVMLLFNPLLDSQELAQRHPQIEVLSVKAHGVLFTHGLLNTFTGLIDEYVPLLHNYIGRVTSKFREQGPYMASTNFAALFEYGDPSNELVKAFSKLELENDYPARVAAKISSFHGMFGSHPLVLRQSREPSAAFATHLDIYGRIYYHSPASHLAFTTLAILLQRIGDKNVLPFVHVSLAFLWSLAFVGRHYRYVEADIPWERLATFLNTLGRTDISESRVTSDAFPQPEHGGCHLPEDFVMRGQCWAQCYYPESYFKEPLADEEERTLELPSMAAPRVERCLWLGYHIASLGPWLSYDKQTRTFAATPYAKSLLNAPGSNPLTKEIKMTDA